ncbi:MAG: hypothetical protein V4582_05185 [Pseudomonadota bacterium]
MRRRASLLALGALAIVLALLALRPAEMASLARRWSPWTPAQAAERDDGAQLSFEAKLIHTILLGRPYGLARADLAFSKLPKNLSGAGFSLASAARQALRIDDAGLPDSHDRLLEFLTSVHTPYPVTGMPPDVAPNMGIDDLAMFQVYALVMSGQADATVELLARHADSSNDYTRAFVLMALRAIGSPRAHELITARAHGPDSMLAADALSLPLPNLVEPKRFAGDVSTDRRERKTLLAQARGDGTLSILPTFLLGFIAAGDDSEQAKAELDFLREQYKHADNALWRKYEYANTALALRSREPYAVWRDMYRADTEGMHKAFILRAMAMQQPERFFEEAPALFEHEMRAAPQMELLGLYRGMVMGDVMYGPFDAVWMPPMRYRSHYPARHDERWRRAPRGLLALWAAGRFPLEEKCSACWGAWVGEMMRPQDQALFLKGYLALPLRDEHAFYPIEHVSDRRLLPVVAYLAERERDPATRAGARAAYDQFARRLRDAPPACCEASEACLRQQLAADDAAPLHFDNDAAAARYLDAIDQAGAKDEAPPARVQITFTDALRRRAIVKGPDGADGQAWEHWLGCWRAAPPAQ